MFIEKPTINGILYIHLNIRSSDWWCYIATKRYTECNWNVRSNFRQEFHIPKQEKMSGNIEFVSYGWENTVDILSSSALMCGQGSLANVWKTHCFATSGYRQTLQGFPLTRSTRATGRCATGSQSTYELGACGRGVGWGTMLQAGRSRVRLPMGVIRFFNWPDPSSCTMAMCLTRPQTEMSTRSLPGSETQPTHKADNLNSILSQLSRKCQRLDILDPCGSPWPVTGIVYLFIINVLHLQVTN
jgi:hypothetical protein